jgi:Zn-dependent protease with chaperone function
MISSFLYNIPTAIINSILLFAIFWLVYQFTIVQLKWSPKKRYQLASFFVLFGSLFFILELVSIKWMSIVDLPILAKAVISIKLMEAPHSWTLSIASIYFILSIVFLVRFIIQYTSLNTLKMTSDFSNTKNYELLIRDSVGPIKTKFKIGMNDTISTPMVFGLLEKVILLPVSLCNNLTPDQLKCILIHELAHILNNDFIINIGIEISTILLWFNPFVFIFKKEIQLQREIACDEYVISKMNDPITYSKALLNTANHSIATKFKLSMAAIASKNDLKIRIQYINGILIGTRNKITFLKSACILSLLLLVYSISMPILLERKSIYSIPSNPVSPVFSKINLSKNIEIAKKVNEVAAFSSNSSQQKYLSSGVMRTAKRINVKSNLNDDTLTLSNNYTAEITYKDLVQQTKNWIKARENNVVYANYNELNSSLDSKEAIEEEMANNLILISIIKNYKLKRALLEQKIKNAADIGEARDFILNSDEWREIVQYEKWAHEYLNRQ